MVLILKILCSTFPVSLSRVSLWKCTGVQQGDLADRLAPQPQATWLCQFPYLENSWRESLQNDAKISSGSNIQHIFDYFLLIWLFTHMA